MRKTHGLSRRLTAALLCLCMVVSMLSGITVRQAYAAAAGQTEHIVKDSRVADPDTMDDYLNRLLTEETGSRYAGRVWTDKSVFAYGDTARAVGSHFNGTNTITLDMGTDGYVGSVDFNADFAHVFSALASSQVVNEYPPSPIDLVIVFDMSGSMGQDTRYEIDPGRNDYVAHTKDGTINGASHNDGFPDEGVLMSDRIANSRIQATLNAINSTIDKLMAQNPQNRVAVCGYGENATVLMPLAHYQRVDKDKDGTLDPYLSVGGMETLYHPSDLVYREPSDHVTKADTELSEVTKAGWYWMNNRDTCYTVVVNAEYNTYTGILDEDGDGSSVTDVDDDPTYKWTEINKTVSNNALTYKGDRVKAFPGAWEHDGKVANDTPLATYKDASVNVYTNASAKTAGWINGESGSDLITAIADTKSMEADDYVGYFTNTQGGIYLAYKQLADSTATTYTELLSNGVISTVARIPAAIIMSDGGANFSFNEMGIEAGSEYAVAKWNSRYGQPNDLGAPGAGYISDDSWTIHDWRVGLLENNDPEKMQIVQADRSHRLGGCIKETGEVEVAQKGDEWYNVFLPGKDTLNSSWNGVHGIYNTGADCYEDGTLTSAPAWSHPGVLYSSDNDPFGTPGTVLQVLLTASYMNQVVKEHYDQGWKTDNATLDSRVPLSTYTMNVDTAHVPQWGRFRLYPTLDPMDYPLDNIVGLVDAQPEKFAAIFGADEWSADTWDAAHTIVFNGLHREWETLREGKASTQAMAANSVYIHMNPIGVGGYNYEAGGEDTVNVTHEEVIANIAYNDGFYDVGSGELDTTFDTILGLILGKVFVPVSGDNDAGVGDSITYQDPIGEYMEIKNQSITAQAHVDSAPTEYDMALLLFGEMHGLVRTGVYDYKWNDAWMQKHNGETVDGVKLEQGVTPFPMGWYSGNERVAGANAFPDGCTSTEDAWSKGYVFRLNNQALMEYVPIVQEAENPGDLTAQAKNTVYTIYRFAGDAASRNKLRRNPIYGDVPDDIEKLWKEASVSGYPVSNEIYAKTPGVYRLSDIRVWVEDTGDFTDTDGAITPNTGYDRSLYVNIPAAAIPTELATITLGRDGVLSYETNLGKDHPVDSQITVEENGKKVEKTVDKAMYENFCAQSTPFRLFYAVGLEEDLILRDGGNQTGVDFNKISPEYISSHTVEGQDYVWFISNYYSETRYDEYATDTVSRTRGDPTVTFSPGSDNRYYVFQKPLPLFAHAYRWSGGGLAPVDNVPGASWDANNRAGNGKTTWENYNGAQQQAGSWAGGQYMGTYKDEAAFQTAYAAAQAEGKGTITDSSGIKYEYVENGIVFLQEDMLRHVTSKAEGGYTDESVSFSSDDYFFLLVEFYVPYKDTTGVDNNGKKVEGTQGGHMVQYALARKGSEFGSGFASSEIDNGDMLCWTDAQNHLNLEFEYLSKTDTGDLTRGEPTYEKLTTTDESALETYLQNTCGIKDEGVLKEQVEYWLKMQSDPLVIAALKAAAAGGEKPSEEQFKKYFSFSVAARPGGIRSGDMSNNVQYKGTEYDEKTGYYKNNVTKTSNTYYLPTVSDNSGTDDNVIINNYLGNNGRLEIANQMLHVTKMLVPPADYTLTEDQLNKEFNYQIFVQGVTGKRTAVRTEYNEYSGDWERRLAYIDVLTDNSDLVMDSSNNRALFDLVNGGSTKTARMVVKDADGKLVYADDDGNPTEEPCNTPENSLYYLYLPSNGTEGTDAQHVRRLYQSGDYDGADKLTSGLDKNGTTTYFVPGTREPSSSEPGAENRNSFREATDGRPAGTRTYWAMDAELIPVSEVQKAESGNALSDVAWQHDQSKHDSENHETLTYHTFLIRKPNSETSETNFTSPYQTRSAYMTVDLNFGYNANKDDGGPGGDSGPMQPGDLYDQVVPTVDRPDLFTGEVATPTYIAQHTAEFTLKHGEGLLLTGLQNRVAYRFTEKLTDDQLAEGYTLKEITHTQQRGSLTTYAPGANKFTDLGDGFTASEGGETYFHTNAKLIESYSTMTGNGNHHEPGKNPACTGGNADEDMGGGSVRHYFVRDGELVDKHYTDDGFSSTRYVVNATAHFGVVDEPTESIVTTQKARTDYTGVYSVFGNTGWFEEQVHYINTFETGTLSITKDLEAQEGTKLTEQDLNTAFNFTLKIDKTGSVGEPAGVYGYTITDAKGTEIAAGRLLPQTGPTPLDPPEDPANDIRLNADGTWHFTLKGGQTMTVEGLPVDSGYTYTAQEEALKDGFDVTDSDTEPNDKTVSGTVTPGDETPVKVTFTNTKKKPEPAQVTLKLKKTVSGAGFTWTDQEFTFLVTPDPGNPAGDPFPTAKQIDVTSTGDTVNIFQNLQFEMPGTYTYTVSEIPSKVPGITSDYHIYTVTVEVSEQYTPEGVYTGKLNVILKVNGAEISDDTIAFTFNNEYNPHEIRVPFQARKILIGADLVKGEFQFELKCTSFVEPTAPVAPASNEERPPVSNGPEETPPSDPANSTEGTEPPEGTESTEGTEPSEGTESTENTEPTESAPTEPTAPSEPVPENTEDGSTEPQSESQPISGRPNVSAPMSSWMLRRNPDEVDPSGETQSTEGQSTEGDPSNGLPSGDTPMPLSVVPEDRLEVSNDENGLVNFGSLTFTEAGTYTFIMRELPGSIPGIKYDETEYTITVVIGEVDGKLTLESITYEPPVPEFDLPTFTNQTATGSLHVEKHVTGIGDKNKDFHFTVTFVPPTADFTGVTITKNGEPTALKISGDGTLEFDLKDGEYLDVEGLPVNTTYTVTEKDYTAEGYITTVTDSEGDQDGAGTIEADVKDEVSFTNDKPTGSLTVSKIVTGEGGDTSKEWNFRVELGDNTVNGAYGDMHFTDGVAQVILRSGESATATDLPAGITYTVTEQEANQDGYTTRSTGTTGSIPADGTAEAEFTNDKPAPKVGSLTVSKTVTGEGGDKNKDFHFTVTFDPAVFDTSKVEITKNGQPTDLTITGGKLEFDLKDGESVTVSGLPAGITYTVTEQEANQDGYTTSSTGTTGSIPADGTAEAEFTNYKPAPEPKTGSLTVSKIVTGEGGDKNKDFHFTVTFDPADFDASKVEVTKNGEPTNLTITGGKLEFDLKDGESVTVSGLPEGTAYTVTEDDYNAEGYTTTSRGETGTIPNGGTTVIFVNDKPAPKTGSLTVSKTVTGDGNKAKDFHFTVTFDPAVFDTSKVRITKNGQPTALTITGGKLEFTLKDGEKVEISGLPAGTAYTVTEQEANQDGYTTSSTGTTGSIPADGTAEAEFTNYKPAPEPKTGSLTVTKTVTGEGGDKNKDFHFTVTFHPAVFDTSKVTITKNGQPTALTITGGKLEFDLKDGESVTVSGLPEGTTYTVTEQEANQDGYTTSSTGESGAIPADGTAKAEFTNDKPAPKTGSLTVSKIVTGDGSDKTKDFHFTVTFTPAGEDYSSAVVTKFDAAGNATSETFAITGGKLEFTLKDGEKVEISGLPEGTAYTVTEDDYTAEGYTTTSAGETGTIPDGEAKAIFVNNKPAPESKTGSLRISKTVTGIGDKDKDFHFTVTFDPADFDTSKVEITKNGQPTDLTITGGKLEFDLKDGESVTITGLLVGIAYTVTEDDYTSEGYTTTSAGETGTIPDGGTTVTFANNKPAPKAGSLTVSKTVTGDGGDKTKDFHFTVTFDPADFDTSKVTITKNGEPTDLTITGGKLEFTLKDGESVTISGLPEGTTYTVTEDDYTSEGYTTSSTGATGDIPADGTAEAEFTNYKPAPEPKTGSLTVSKTVTGEGGDKTKDFHFTVTFDPADFDASKVTITKNGEPTDLTVTGGKLEFDLKDGESLTVSGLPEGTTYTVTEQEANQDGYTTTSTGATGAIPADGTAEAEFTNDKPAPKTGSLTVSKTVTGDGGNKTRDFHFTVTFDPADFDASKVTITKNGQPTDLTITGGKLEFDLKDGESVTVFGLPEGTAYTVTEDDYTAEGYTTSSTGATGAIPADGTAEAEFTNDKPAPKTGSLTVSKTVTGDGGDKTKDFHFTVTFDPADFDASKVTITKNGQPTDLTITGGKLEFDLKDGESVTISGLPEGTTYTVTEQEANQDGYTTTSTGATGAIPADGTAEAEFTNDKPAPKTGSLTVSKIVTGDGSDKTKDFHFTVTFDPADFDASKVTITKNGQPTDLTITGGKLEFDLKDGESVTITGLPEGTAYTVTEDDYTAEGYTTTSAGETGTIPDGGATVTFVNDRPTPPPSSTPTTPRPTTEPTTPPPPSSTPGDTPKTGDGSMLGLWVMLAVCSMSCAVWTGLSAAKAAPKKNRRH